MNLRFFGATLFSLLLIAGIVAAIQRQPVSQSEAYAASSSSLLPNEPTDRSPEAYRGSFFYSTAAEMLAAQGVSLAPEDKIFAFPDPALRLGSQVRVYRASQVTVADGGDTWSARSWSPTVGEFLQDRHVSIGDKDVVSPNLSTPLDPMHVTTITITRVAVREVSEQEPIDFATVYKDAPDLERGKQSVKQQGKEGVRQKTYRERWENNRLVEKTLVGTSVLVPPTDTVILKGSKVISYGTVVSSWYGGVPPLTAAHPSLPFGTRIRVVNVATGAAVTVTVDDRGPFVPGRGLDLSSDAFAQIAPLGSGTVTVTIEKAE